MGYSQGMDKKRLSFIIVDAVHVLLLIAAGLILALNKVVLPGFLLVVAGLVYLVAFAAMFMLPARQAFLHRFAARVQLVLGTVLLGLLLLSVVYIHGIFGSLGQVIAGALAMAVILVVLIFGTWPFILLRRLKEDKQ